MIILGIDPGSRVSGYCVLQKKGRQFEVLDSGVLRFAKKEEAQSRILQTQEAADALAVKFRPHVVAIEKLIFAKNPHSLLRLAEVRGVLLSSFIRHCSPLEICEYAPNVVKSTVAGYGHASKEMLQGFLNQVLGKREYKTHDESDATAIALCCGILGRQQKSLGGAGKRSLGSQLQHKLRVV